MFVFILQFLFYHDESYLGCLVKDFFKGLVGVFSYTFNLPASSLISVATFTMLLTCCFGGYFTYSFCPCGIVEFTFVYASVA